MTDKSKIYVSVHELEVLCYSMLGQSPKVLTICSLSFQDDPKKTGHLLALEGAKDRLQLFKANLLEEGSFDAAVAGCEGVFHTASPFTHAVDDPQVLFVLYLAVVYECISNKPCLVFRK